MVNAFVTRDLGINVLTMFQRHDGLKLGQARKAYKRIYDREMTQDRFAELLTRELGYEVTRDTLAKWETDPNYSVPETAIAFARRLMSIDDEYFSSGYEGPVLFKTPTIKPEKNGTTTVAERRHGYVTVSRGHGSSMWRQSEVSLKSQQVPRFLLNYREYVEVPDLTLLPYIKPGNVLAFSHAAMPILGKIHLLRKITEPDLLAIREIRQSEDGRPELYTPEGTAAAVSLADWEPFAYLVCVAYDLAPFHGIINERGIAFSELRQLA